MQHNQVIDENLVEQYMLDEMSAPQRDAFEEHFFECRECAADVRATAAFMDIARDELKRAYPAAAAQAAVTEAAPARRWGSVDEPPVKRWWHSLWNPAFAFATAAACLLVVGYQNLVTYPLLTSQVARLESPEVLPTLSLAGSASRGGAVPTATVAGSGPLALAIDIPSRADFSSYTLRFLSSANVLLSTVEVSAAQARDTVSVRIPAGAWGAGQYAVEVMGNTGGAQPGVNVARYPFALTSGPSTSGK